MNEINIDVNSIKRQVSKQLLDIAKRAGDKIQQGFKSSIQQFYGSYPAEYYDRTYSLFTASSAYGGRPTYQKLGDMRYSCGIVAGSAYISGNPYSHSGTIGVTPGQVWESAFIGGMHGVPRGFVAATTTSPQSIMDNNFEAVKAQVQQALGNITFTL